MNTRKTIFLATDGRHATLGRGEVEISDATLSAIRAQALGGWIAWLDSPSRSNGNVALVKVAVIGCVGDDEWEASVVAFRTAQDRPIESGHG